MVMVVTQMASPPTFNEIRVDFVSHGGGFVSHGGEPSLGRCPAGKMLKLLLGGCRKGKGDHGNPDLITEWHEKTKAQNVRFL